MDTKLMINSKVVGLLSNWGHETSELHKQRMVGNWGMAMRIFLVLFPSIGFFITYRFDLWKVSCIRCIHFPVSFHVYSIIGMLPMMEYINKF